MKLFNRIAGAFNAFMGRGYSQIVNPTDEGSVIAQSRGSETSEEADVWQNAWGLLQRMATLTRENPTFTRYEWDLNAAVFSESGFRLRLPIFEDEDRKINAKEKAVVRRYEARWDSVLEHAAKKRGEKAAPFLLTREGKDDLKRAMNGSGIERQATLKAGSPDMDARQKIMAAFMEWQEAQYCDAGGVLNYAMQEHICLWGAVTCGELIARMVSNPKKDADGEWQLNKFGFALQLIGAQWLDRFYNGELPNGNIVRQGIEYKKRSWGRGKPVAYYLIKRTPKDWQWSAPAGRGWNFSGAAPADHDRIPASEIIHYKRTREPDTTRPAPWAAACIPTAQHLADYARYAVIASREACKNTGWLESSISTDAAEIAALKINDPRVAARQLGQRQPGGVYGLAYGVTYKGDHPEHPTTTFSDFSNWQGRFQSAGMPGASYSNTFSDWGAVTFSSAKMEELFRSAVIGLMQQFHITAFSVPVFRQWLYMSLVTGAIDLPLSKFDKFNRPVFQGPKMAGVDEVKDCNAAALRVANTFSTRRKESAYMGNDWDEDILELAEEKMKLEQLGMDASPVTNKPIPVTEVEATIQDGKPAPKKDAEEFILRP